MSRIDRNHGMRHTFAAAALAVALGAIFAATTADARSITGVRHLTPRDGVSSLNVTFEAGEPGDEHALYIAYDTEDKGGDISDWTALQRGCVVAADATSATIPLSPLLTDEGYTFCRVFLTTSAAPYVQSPFGFSERGGKSSPLHYKPRFRCDCQQNLGHDLLQRIYREPSHIRPELCKEHGYNS